MEKGRNRNAIWALQGPSFSPFAFSWLRSPPIEVSEPCRQCSIRTVYKESYPLSLEWEAGSDQVGDFSWPGGGRIAVELIVSTVVPALPRSTTQRAHQCKACGAEAYNLTGVEEKGSRWNIKRGKLVPFHRNRKPGKGLFVLRKSLGGASFFRCEPFSGHLLCIDNGRNFIEKNGWNTVEFLEFGELI
jgi:hypothetical protein